MATKLAGVVLGICRPSHCGPTAPLLSEHISGQCRLRLSGVSAEQAPPDRLPADFAFPVQELRPGWRLPITGTAYHDERFATLTNVVDQYNTCMGLGPVERGEERSGSILAQPDAWAQG